MRHRQMRRFISAGIAAACLIAVASCSESAVGPEPDALTAAAAKLGADRILAISLTTPNADDAGLVFSVEGPNILDVVPAAGYDLVNSSIDGKGKSRVDVVLIGQLKTGVVAYAMVKGASANPFTATVSQAAAGASGNYVQRSELSAYKLAVTVQR